jgi:hypothetical protein
VGKLPKSHGGQRAALLLPCNASWQENDKRSVFAMTQTTPTFYAYYMKGKYKAPRHDDVYGNVGITPSFLTSALDGD